MTFQKFAGASVLALTVAGPVAAQTEIDSSHAFTGRLGELVAEQVETFNSSQSVQEVRLEYRQLQYLYNDGVLYYFMDTETYEQLPVDKVVVEEAMQYLKENADAKLTFYEGKVIDIEVPQSVDLLVTSAEVAVRGDTATGLTKRVTVETGLSVAVPSFVVEGDVIRVNTTTGDYVTRVKE